MKRPCTRSRWLRTTRKRSSRPMNSDMRKKSPVKVKLKGIVGKPAAPTAAPGGSVAVVACVAGAPGDGGAEARDSRVGAGVAALGGEPGGSVGLRLRERAALRCDVVGQL